MINSSNRALSAFAEPLAQPFTVNGLWSLASEGRDLLLLSSARFHSAESSVVTGTLLCRRIIIYTTCIVLYFRCNALLWVRIIITCLRRNKLDWIVKSLKQIIEILEIYGFQCITVCFICSSVYHIINFMHVHAKYQAYVPYRDDNNMF